MALVLEIPLTLPAFDGERLLATCASLFSTAASTSVTIPLADTSADVLITAAGETTGFGRVIDRLRQPIGTYYGVAVVQGYIASTRGSTEADRKLTIGGRLQHGDSSGGGDMVDWSTGSQQAARSYFSTARSTDALAWDGSESTGPVFAVSTPAFFDITGAKRYIRAAIPVLKNRVTTESSGDEQCRVGGFITLMAGTKVPQRLDTTGPYSNSTSTV